jgi:tetratricopeptide (TPR) repeat protein
MKNLSQIERYINHEMNDGELWEFQRNLKNDPQLAEELWLVQAMGVVSNSAQNLSLMNLMDNIRQEEEKKQKFMVFSKRSLAYAASLLVLIAAGVALWFYSNKSVNEKVFLAYYHPEPVSFAVRSATLGSDQPVKIGLELFDQGEYAMAIGYFSQSPANPMGRLYSGLALMEMGEYTKAIAHFKTILQQENNLFTDQAAWYLSLCYLRTNKQKDLEATLQEIASSHSIYKTKAKKLMHELGIAIKN